MPKYFINPFAISGDKVAIPDDTQPSGVVSYEEGFGIDYQKVLGTDPDALPIPRSQTNQLNYDITSNIQQYQQHGFPEFITADDNGGVPFPYDIYAVVLYQPSDIEPFFLYQSLVSGNDTMPTDTTKWSQLGFIPPPIPPGMIMDFGGITPPDGFLLCDGSAVSRTGDTANLFAAIGITWGPGDGSTTFNLPNFARRTAVGSGGSGTGELGNAVGDVGGEENHTLTTGEVPNLNVTVSQESKLGDATGGGNVMTATGALSGYTLDMNGATTNGGGGAHNNIQPSAIVLKIIKT